MFGTHASSAHRPALSSLRLAALAAAAGAATLLAPSLASADDDRTFRGLRKGDYDNGHRNESRGSHRNDRDYNRGHDRGYNRGGDRTKININLGFNTGYSRGYSSSYYSSSYHHRRYDDCGSKTVIIDRPRYRNDVVIIDRDRDCDDRWRRPVIIDRPCPPPVVVVDKPCPPPVVVVDRSPPPRVIVQEAAPTVIVRQASYTTEYNVLARERGDEQFRQGRVAIAADLYRLHLRDIPTDDTTRRSLGFALLLDQKLEDAIGVISQAYTTTPTLARSPISLAMLPDGGSSLGTRFQEVKAIADRSNSAAGYLTAAVIAQSIASYDAAAQMLERARQCGLKEDTAVELTLAVTNAGR